MFFKLNKKPKMFFRLKKKLLFIQEENNWKQTSRNAHQKTFWNHDVRPEYFATPNNSFLQYDILVNTFNVCITIRKFSFEKQRRRKKYKVISDNGSIIIKREKVLPVKLSQ